MTFFTAVITHFSTYSSRHYRFREKYSWVLIQNSWYRYLYQFECEMYPTLYIGLFSTCCENLRMRRDYSVQGWCTKSKETKNKTPVTASQLHWVLWIEKNQRNKENSAIPGEEDDKAFILKPTHFSCSGLHRGYQIDVL